MNFKRICHSVFYTLVEFSHLEGYKKGLRISGQVKFRLNRNARIKIVENGHLDLGCDALSYRQNPLWLRMDHNSRFEVDGDASIYYDGDIIIFNNGVLKMGNSFINSHCKIRCHNRITIGDRCAISHDFTIMDSNAHTINSQKKTSEVVIGDHVWIGTRVTILPGVHIGNGAVIGAGTVVTRDIPSNSLAVGCPARVIKENVDWKE